MTGLCFYFCWHCDKLEWSLYYFSLHLGLESVPLNSIWLNSWSLFCLSHQDMLKRISNLVSLRSLDFQFPKYVACPKFLVIVTIVWWNKGHFKIKQKRWGKGVSHSQERTGSTVSGNMYVYNVFCIIQ